MSLTQNYFPPNGTKYKWNSKALNYSPWTCHVWELWPASISASVDKIESGFKWRVDVWGWHNKDRSEHTKFEGIAESALAACLAAERCAEKQKSKLWKPWMEEAIKAGWRP